MLIVKETADLSFERLHTEAKAIGYDARTDQAKEKDGGGCGVPCPSQLHRAMTRIPEEYLQKALRLPDQMVAQMYAELFGDENLWEYSVDSTEDTCTILEEAQVAMRTVPRHRTVRCNILTRLATSTVGAVDALTVQEYEGCKTPSGAGSTRLGSVHGPWVRCGVQLPVCSRERSNPHCASEAVPGKALQGALPPPGSEELRQGEVSPPQACGEAHRKQGGEGRRHAEVPETRHGAKGAHSQVHSSQCSRVVHAASLEQHFPTGANPVRVRDNTHRKPQGSRHSVWQLGSGAATQHSHPKEERRRKPEPN